MLHRYKEKGQSILAEGPLSFSCSSWETGIMSSTHEKMGTWGLFFTFSTVLVAGDSNSVLFEEDVFYLMTSPGYLQCIFRTISQLK